MIFTNDCCLSRLVNIKSMIIYQLFFVVFIFSSCVTGFIHNSHYTKTKISKCCPIGSELVQNDDNLPMDVHPVLRHHSDEKRFSCREIVVEGNSTVANLTMFGYNLHTSDTDEHIPSCSDVELFEFGYDSGLISSDGCLDYFNGAVYGLRCSDRSQVEVHRLLKCCPAGWSYELTERQCIENPTNIGLFQNFSRNAVILFTTKTPQCREDGEEVFVEYFSNRYGVSLDRGGIIVSSSAHDFLYPGSFCVEGIVHREHNGTGGVRGTGDLIFRTCQPRSICNRMPCVRRCCRNEQLLTRQNNKTVCVDYSRNIKPMFYDVSLPLQIGKPQKQVEPEGRILFYCIEN